MKNPASSFAETGLEVIDIQSDAAFAARRLHTRDIALQMEGVRRLTHALVENPDTILQELVNAAVNLCGAESAGISIELDPALRTDAQYYRWAATAGKYGIFSNAFLPRYPSACGVCLERNSPQLFHVSQRFFDLMGVEAPLVHDGILLPWQAGDTRGTIWIMSHGSSEVFDIEDVRMMQMLADFAAMATRQQRQQKALMEQATNAAAASMANDLAHQINNPLQSLTNLVFMAHHGHGNMTTEQFAQQLTPNLNRLAELTGKLLSLPISKVRSA